MRTLFALALAASLLTSCCCRRTCCAPLLPARANAAPDGIATALPSGALEATLLYARGAAAARSNAAEARIAWQGALAALGEAPGPERME